MVAKGRQARGEEIAQSKLSEAEVEALRLRFATTVISQRRLAAEAGVTSATMRGIIAGRIWKYAPGPVTGGVPVPPGTLVTIDGVTRNLRGWSNAAGESYHALRRRVRRCGSPEEAVRAMVRSASMKSAG